MLQRFGGLAIVSALALTAGCLRQYVPAPVGTPLDVLCEPFPLDPVADWSAWELNGLRFRTPRTWGVRERGPNSLTLARIDAELNAWNGAPWVFPAVEPRQSVRCDITHGDTTMHIRGVRLRGSQSFRVDVSWEPIIGDRWQYMQLQTRYVEHLREMRGILESVRFPDPNPPRGSVSRPR
jgi:hypothetical protein